MGRHFITILLVLAFITPALANIGQCEMTSQGCSDEMACCAQAQAITGSATARLCCEMFCGKPFDKGAEPVANVTLPASLFASVSSAPSTPILIQQFTVQVNQAIRTVNSALQQQRPLPRFLSHSAFLI